MDFKEHRTSKDANLSENSGKFYQRLLQDPDRYIQPQPELKKMLKQLKESGKPIFCTTNAYLKHTDLVLKTTFGEDWKDLFDLILIHCQKPLFQKAENSFYALPYGGTAARRGVKIDSVSKFAVHAQARKKVFLEGNCQILTKYFMRTLKNQAA